MPHQGHSRTGRPDGMGPGTLYQKYRTQDNKSWTTPHWGHHHRVTKGPGELLQAPKPVARESGTLHEGSRIQDSKEKETPLQGHNQPDTTEPETTRPGRRTRPQ